MVTANGADRRDGKVLSTTTSGAPGTSEAGTTPAALRVVGETNVVSSSSVPSSARECASNPLPVTAKTTGPG